MIRRTVHWALLGAVVAAVALAGCGKRNAEKSESIADIQKREGVPVEVVTARSGDLLAYEVTGGTAEGSSQATVTASIPGTIAEIKVRVGQQVEKDVSMMRIEPDMPSNSVTAQKSFETLEKSRERTKALADQGGVSQDVVDQLDAGYTAAQQGLASARRAELVLAPFAGTVVAVPPSVNARVSNGTELVKIAKLDKIRIVMSISDALIYRFAKGQKAFVTVGPDTVWGAVDDVPMAAKDNHTFDVNVLFPNQRRLLRPGMYLTVNVAVESRKNVVSLPMDAVVQDGAEKFVFVVRNGAAVKTPVTVGIRAGTNYEIVRGVAAGDQVVVAGASSLGDGMKVKAVD